MDMERMNLNNPQLRRNAMRVPEGYFDDLAVRVMARIPKEEETTSTATLVPRRRRWWMWSMGAAAAIALVMGFVQMLPSLTQGGAEETALLDDDVYEQQVLDYAMVDDADIYAYLAGN